MILKDSSIRELFTIRAVTWGTDDNHIIYEQSMLDDNKLILAEINYDSRDIKEIVLMQDYTLNGFVIDADDNAIIAIQRDDDSINIVKIRFGIALPEFDNLILILIISMLVFIVTKFGSNIARLTRNRYI